MADFNFIHPSDANKFQDDYLKLLERVLKTIDKFRKQASKYIGEKLKNLDPKKEVDELVKIFVNGKLIYEGKLSEAGKITELNSKKQQEIATLLKTALENPEQLQGSVRIDLGKDRVFFASNGQVKIDALGLNSAFSQSRQTTQETTQQATQKTAPARQTAPEPTFSTPPTKKSLSNQELIAILERQDAKIDLLARRVEQLQKQNERLASQLKNPSLSGLFGQIKTAFSNFFKNLVQSIQQRYQEYQQNKALGKAENFYNQFEKLTKNGQLGHLTNINNEKLAVSFNPDDNSLTINNFAPTATVNNQSAPAQEQDFYNMIKSFVADPDPDLSEEEELEQEEQQQQQQQQQQQEKLEKNEQVVAVKERQPQQINLPPNLGERLIELMKQPQMVEMENGNLIHDSRSYFISYEQAENLISVKDKQTNKVLINDNKLHNKATQEDFDKLGDFVAFAEDVLKVNTQSNSQGLDREQENNQSRGKGRGR